MRPWGSDFNSYHYKHSAKFSRIFNYWRIGRVFEQFLDLTTKEEPLQILRILCENEIMDPCKVDKPLDEKLHEFFIVAAQHRYLFADLEKLLIMLRQYNALNLANVGTLLEIKDDTLRSLSFVLQKYSESPSLQQITPFEEFFHVMLQSSEATRSIIDDLDSADIPFNEITPHQLSGIVQLVKHSSGSIDNFAAILKRYRLYGLLGREQAIRYLEELKKILDGDQEVALIMSGWINDLLIFSEIPEAAEIGIRDLFHTYVKEVELLCEVNISLPTIKEVILPLSADERDNVLQAVNESNAAVLKILKTKGMTGNDITAFLNGPILNLLDWGGYAAEWLGVLNNPHFQNGFYGGMLNIIENQPNANLPNAILIFLNEYIARFGFFQHIEPRVDESIYFSFQQRSNRVFELCRINGNTILALAAFPSEVRNGLLNVLADSSIVLCRFLKENLPLDFFSLLITYCSAQINALANELNKLHESMYLFSLFNAINEINSFLTTQDPQFLAETLPNFMDSIIEKISQQLECIASEQLEREKLEQQERKDSQWLKMVKDSPKLNAFLFCFFTLRDPGDSHDPSHGILLKKK